MRASFISLSVYSCKSLFIIWTCHNAIIKVSRNLHVAVEKLEYKFIVDQSNYVEISILKLYMKINISQIVCIILSFFINYKKLHKFFVNFSFSLSTINRFILDICTQVLSTILLFWSIYVLICIVYFF